jgi:hypothetical protein
MLLTVMTVVATRTSREVAPMKFYPELASVALPAALVPAAQVGSVPATAVLPQMHQAVGQPGLARPSTAVNEETTGFAGMGIRLTDKRTDVRGVPPRGRPV